MAAVASMLSAIMKAAVTGGKIKNELVGELIGISTDQVSKEAVEDIQNFLNEKKYQIEHILSKDHMKSMNIPEENCSYVVEEIKDLFKKIEITDEIMAQCRYNSLKLSSFLWDQYCESRKGSYIECEDSIQKGLFAVAVALIKLTYGSEEFEGKCLIQINNTAEEIKLRIQDNAQDICKRLDKVEESTQAIYMKVDKISTDQYQHEEPKKVESRTQEYANKWNENMFLNNFSQWDENAGKNVKLRDVYIEAHLPHFVWRANKKETDGLKELLQKYTRNDYGRNQMLLILGQPGIGKSTLVTWMTANLPDKAEDTLVYQFAADLKNVDQYCMDQTQRQLLLGELKLSFDDLNGKILILEGFDEINAGRDRGELLNQIYKDLNKANLLHKVLLIVTCREHYIHNVQKLDFDYITLQPWDSGQIQSFCEIYCEKAGRSISETEKNNIINNREVLGIPLILYMTMALDISIDEEGSIVDVYDRIFSLKDGGIYERCFKNPKYNRIARYGDVNWISMLKEPIHQISREIAIWMFENNPDKASIPRREYRNICGRVIREQQLQRGESIGQDFLIGNYFKLVRHCEGVESEELCFVHRSIYEYFVAETIFSSIENALNELSNESQIEFAGNIAQYLKKGELSQTISQYLAHKLRKQYSTLDSAKQQGFYWWWERAIDKMMDVGMFYYSKPVKHETDGMLMEVKCFMNLIEILRNVPGADPRKCIGGSVKRKSLEKYIRYYAVMFSVWRERATFERINLRKLDLKYLDLHAIDLAGADLAGADLMKADLEGANLTKADLQRVNLLGANLRKADLRAADLRKANLRKADLRGAVLEYVNNGYTKSDAQRLGSARLKDSCINASIWREKDILKLKQLDKTTYTNLVIEDGNGNRISRRGVRK